MSGIPLKRFVPRFVGSLIGAAIFEIIAFFYIPDRKFTTFIAVLLVVSESISIIYDSYYPRPGYTEPPRSLLPVTNDVPVNGEKMNDETPSGQLPTQNSGHSMWFKISAVSTLSIFFRIISSTWTLSLAICVNYLLLECYQYLNRVYVKLFPSNMIFFDLVTRKSLKSTRDLSKKKIIFITLCIDLVQFLLLWGISVISLAILMPGIFDTVYRYCEDIINSADDNTSLRYKISNYIANIFETCPEYIIVLTITIVIRILPYCTN